MSNMYPLKISSIETSNNTEEYSDNNNQWGLICTEEFSNTIENGEFAGQTISQLLQQYGTELIGNKYQSAKQFPIYAKITSGKAQSSIMIHDNITLENGTKFCENNKLWYVTEKGSDNKVFAGLKAGATSKYRFVVDKTKISSDEIIASFNPNIYDAFYLPNKRLHSLYGDDLKVWEIGQSTSSPLVFDESNYEEFQAASNAINFQDNQITRIAGETGVFRSNKKNKILQYCPYFFVFELYLVDHILDKTNPNSFMLLIIIEGTLKIKTKQNEELFYKNEVCLLPANLGEYDLLPVDGTVRLLQVTPNFHGR